MQPLVQPVGFPQKVRFVLLHSLLPSPSQVQNMIPLDCLSLFANILQFIDFTSRLVAKSNDIARSTDGRLSEHADLYAISSDLTDLKTKLRESKQLLSIHASLTEEDQKLIRLSDGCLEVAKELQGALDELRSSGKGSKWRSVRQALKTVRRKEHIDSLHQRLSWYRTQLDSRELANMATRVELIKAQQSEGFEQLVQEIRTVDNDLRTNAVQRQEQLIDVTTENARRNSRTPQSCTRENGRIGNVTPACSGRKLLPAYAKPSSHRALRSTDRPAHAIQSKHRRNHRGDKNTGQTVRQRGADRKRDKFRSVSQRPLCFTGCNRDASAGARG